MRKAAAVFDAARIAAASHLRREAAAGGAASQVPEVAPPRAAAAESLAPRRPALGRPFAGPATPPRRIALPAAAAAVHTRALQAAQRREMGSAAVPDRAGPDVEKLDKALDTAVMNAELWARYSGARNADGQQAALAPVRDLSDAAHTHLLTDTSPSDADVKGLSAIKDKARAVIDAAPLLALTAESKSGPLTPSGLVRHLGVDPAHLSSPRAAPGIAFTDDEKCALHLNSVSDEIKRYSDPDKSDLAKSVWRAIGAAQRHPEAKYLAHPTRELLGPLDAGLAKLPHTPGITLYRGLKLGTAAEAEVFARGFKPGETVSMRGHQMCSAKGPYAGEVYLTIKTAPNASGAVSSGALNYNPHEIEGVLRDGGRYEVLSNETLQPGDARHAALTKSTAANASSGRVADGRAAACEIVLQELPRDPNR
jgi:hypothetical protein